MKATARKTKYGNYKAVIVHRGRRTEILGKCYALTPDRRDTFICKPARAYVTRQEAIDVAQQTINFRISERLRKGLTITNNTHGDQP